MACALKADPIIQLEENLQCTVCLETLKDPITLPCFHSFCKDCLEGVVKTCRDKAPRDQPAIRDFHCPDCRSTFTLDPDKHVADMLRNHFVCNMVQATAVLDRVTRIPCSHNCSQGFSVARCVTCEKFLCRECLKDHNKYRGHNSHSVLSMEELSRSENRKKIQGKMYCNEHSGKTLKVYCETCDQLICKDCMDFKHLKQNHSCLLVKEVANNYKELLASNNNAMENALTEGNDFLERLSRETEQLDKDAENTKQKIMQNKDAMLKSLAEMLDKKAETLLNGVEQTRKGGRTELDGQTEETKRYVENIKLSVQLSKKLVEQGTEEEIISSQKMMLYNANNLLTKRSEYFKTPMRVVKCGYTPCNSARKELLNEEIAALVENCLGEVEEGTDKDKDGRAVKDATEEKVCIEKYSCVCYYKNVKVSVYQGDITKETSDVIVNPATEELKHSGGTAAAIVKAGGKSIQTESDDIMKKRWSFLNPGDVVATGAGNLHCDMIVHVVGPRWSNYYHKDEAKKVLLSAVLNSLTVARINGATSISMPAISSGVFGVPVRICAEVLFTAIINFTNKYALEINSLKAIRLVNIDKPTTQVFVKEMQKQFGSNE